jgi:citrate synthase
MEVPGSRAKRYARQDVLALQKRLPRGRRPPSDAKTSLDWGAPVLESALTLIERGRLYYRGRDIAGIEPTATLEDVAALLWGDGAEAGFAAGNLPNTRAALGLHPSARVSIFQLSRTPEK